MKPADPIRLCERDFFLGLDKLPWPPDDLSVLKKAAERRPRADSDLKHNDKITWRSESWSRGRAADGEPSHLWRRLKKCTATGTGLDSDGTLFETVIRFPSAPLFGIQRKRDYQYRLTPVHQHTLRLLTASKPGVSVQRIFLFLNGLNEIDHFGFYYDLASRLIYSGDSSIVTACLVCPYPGHLTRYPMIGRFAEKPLQRFIMDPSDLFRQYLRFMIEMQWLLSIVVPVSYYPVAPGLPLLAESRPNDPGGGRCKSEILSEAMYEEWKRIYESSKRLAKSSPERKALKKRDTAPEVTQDDIRHSVETIRHLIGWAPASVLTRQQKWMPKPGIHVVGYSLGGYLAQSAFFSWPFALGSCTSLCSGAALHTLRPVRMAHEEEWRAITHGLKYEIESGMLENRIRLEPGKAGKDSGRSDHRTVCGIRASYFSSHFQIFTDVFLQDPHGSYRPRVSEYAPRLLFVVGGNDPIVPTESVLDASPPEGINLIEIANLSHFIAFAGGEWAAFWLPTVAKVIFSLSGHSENLLATSVLYNLWSPTTTGPAEGDDFHDPPGHHSSDSKTPYIDAEPLDSEHLRAALSEIVDNLANGAFLFVFRNQIPFTLMGKRLLHRRGTAPHYEDFQIRRFWQEMQRWTASMAACPDRVTLVIPGRLNEWFVKAPSVLSGKSLPLARELPGKESLAAIWNDFLATWENNGALRRFDPEWPEDISGRQFALERMVREQTDTPDDHPILNCLPDVWVGLRREAADQLAGKQGSDRDGIHKGLLSFGLNPLGAIGVTRANLENGDLRIIRVSAAQANPRFLGEQIRDADHAMDLLNHSALALARSTCCAGEGSFAKGWPRRRLRSSKRR